jgi:hypothetical protein
MLLTPTLPSVIPLEPVLFPVTRLFTASRSKGHSIQEFHPIKGTLPHLQRRLTDIRLRHPRHPQRGTTQPKL